MRTTPDSPHSHPKRRPSDVAQPTTRPPLSPEEAAAVRARVRELVHDFAEKHGLPREAAPANVGKRRQVQCGECAHWQDGLCLARPLAKRITANMRQLAGLWYSPTAPDYGCDAGLARAGEEKR